MKKLIYSVGIMCLGVMIASCGSSKKTACPASLNGEWNIVEVEGKTISPENEQPVPVIGFDFETKRIYGNSGCNRMMGTFTVDSLKPGILHFGPIAGTRMACPDMTTEQNVLGALEKVNSFEVISCDKKEDAACKMALCDKDGNKVVVIEKKEVEKTPVTMASLNGEWLIKTVNGAPVGKSEKIPFIGFDTTEGRVYGTAGCNSINGAIKPDENNPTAIDLGRLATTMMMCADMETETAVLGALNTVKSFNVLEDGTLAFYNADGEEVMTLNKK